jgi:hypothetical protein
MPRQVVADSAARWGAAFICGRGGVGPPPFVVEMNGVDELDNTPDRMVGVMSADAGLRNPVLGVRLPREELLRLLAVARVSGLSRSELARQALHLFLNGHVNPLLTDTTKTAVHTSAATCRDMAASRHRCDSAPPRYPL